MESSTDRGVRVAELIGALSLATDLGLGQPQEHVLRQTMIARRLAAAAGCSEDDQDTVFYVSLLAWVGCISDSHELSKWFGDDIALRSDSYDVDKAGLPLVRFMVGHIGTDAPALRRLTILGRFLASGRSQAARSFVAHCQTTADIADRLGLSESVRVALGHSFERWDGMGAPDGLRGDQIDLAMRIVQIADDAEVHQRLHGTRQAAEMVRSRRGTEFDPALVDVLTDHAAEIFDGLDDVDAWDRVLDSTHLGAEVVDDDALTGALEAFADYADLKSAWFLGHSRGVAALASGAAENVGLPADEIRLIERAGLVHDLGVIGVSSGIWDKDGVLSPTELERVRTHPYLTERVLRRQPKLAEIGALAVLHHERLDGSGYPSGLRSGSIPFSARIVAAADVYHAMGEDRPHRRGRPVSDRIALLRGEVSAGRLDGDAVEAVLHCAGVGSRRRPTLPAGLTPREAEVLVLVASGLPTKEIARRLSVSPRTVSSHIEHVYAKIGVSTRGAAAMFAMRNGLVRPDAPD